MAEESGRPPSLPLSAQAPGRQVAAGTGAGAGTGHGTPLTAAPCPVLSPPPIAPSQAAATGEPPAMSTVAAASCDAKEAVREEKKPLKPCCACPETKKARDAW